MAAYRTIIVGTDGSESSLKAVEKAGAIAGDADAQLVVACAYFPNDATVTGAAEDLLKDEAYQIRGGAPVYQILRTARERATAAGARAVAERAVMGSPSDGLLSLVHEMAADLLVVGNRGLKTVAGRLLGSVPSEVPASLTATYWSSTSSADHLGFRRPPISLRMAHSDT